MISFYYIFRIFVDQKRKKFDTARRLSLSRNYEEIVYQIIHVLICYFVNQLIVVYSPLPSTRQWWAGGSRLACWPRNLRKKRPLHEYPSYWCREREKLRLRHDIRFFSLPGCGFWNSKVEDRTNPLVTSMFEMFIFREIRTAEDKLPRSTDFSCPPSKRALRVSVA